MHKNNEYKTEKMVVTINYIDHTIDILNGAKKLLEKMGPFHQEHCLNSLAIAESYIQLCERHCNRAIAKRHEFLIKNSCKENKHAH